MRANYLKTSRNVAPFALRAFLIRFLKVTAMLLIGGIWLAPTLGLLVVSFRSQADILRLPWWDVFFDWRLTLENYHAVLTRENLPKPGLGQNFFNSFIVTIPATVLTVLLAAFASYSLVFMKLPGRTLIFAVIIALLVVPMQITWVPVLKMYNSIGIIGTWAGIWIAHAAYGMAFAIFLLRNFFVDIPPELVHSARVDGANHFKVFFLIIFPVSVPALASLTIFQFMWVWNDLMNSLIYLQDNQKYPLTVGIKNLLGQYGGEWHLLAAGAWISMLIPLCVFFGLQRFFVRGITAGSVKG